MGTAAAISKRPIRQAGLRFRPIKPKYSLRRVWLKPQEENGYYYGVSNNALWPLCHIAYARPVFNQGDWRQYVAVNRRFADVVLEEIAGTRAIVFVQDYHYALLPRFVKAARPDAVVCQFWHIPWPNPEAFRILPWQSEVLDGLLGNDLLGFHLQYHCNNFLETVDRSMEARIDQETFSVLLPRASHGDPAVSDQHRSLDVERHRSGLGVDEGSGGDAAGVSTSAIGASSWASIGSTTPRAFPIVCWRSIDSWSDIPSGAGASCWCRSARRRAIGSIGIVT